MSADRAQILIEEKHNGEEQNITAKLCTFKHSNI